MAGEKRYTAKALETAVNEYFNGISYSAPIVDESGKPVRNELGNPVIKVEFITPPSITGLCLQLGITRRTWSNYGRDDKLGRIVERARARIELYLEEQLMTRTKGVTGVIFNLQANFGWRQRQEVELGERAARSMELSGVPLSERRALLEEMAKAYAQDATGDQTIGEAGAGGDYPGGAGEI